MAQATGTIRTYTVPVKDFDPAKEAATCRATAGCTSFLVIPVKKDNSQPMKGPFTSMSVTLKATSTGTWLNVDPADRARVDELCVGTFLLAADVKPSPSPSPAKGNNSTGTAGRRTIAWAVWRHTGSCMRKHLGQGGHCCTCSRASCVCGSGTLQSMRWAVARSVMVPRRYRTHCARGAPGLRPEDFVAGC